MNESTSCLQEQFFPTSTCFGCGPANVQGLRLRSYRDLAAGAPSSRVIATFRTAPHHDNGLGYVNGGIIATLLDCNSAGSAMVQATQLGWKTEVGAVYPCVTAGLDLRYLRPTPLAEDLTLAAWVDDHSEDEIAVVSTIACQDKVRAEALVRWRRWRPRTTAVGG